MGIAALQSGTDVLPGETRLPTETEIQVLGTSTTMRRITTLLRQSAQGVIADLHVDDFYARCTRAFVIPVLKVA